MAFDDQRQRDFASLGHQNIVSPAGGLIVHAFNPDSFCIQTLHEPGMDKLLALASTQNDNIRQQRRYLLKMLCTERVERSNLPVDRGHFRQHQQAPGVACGIDLNGRFIVAGDGLVLLGWGDVKLHNA